MKPTLFIGSSGESLEIAHAMQENLEVDFEVTVWDQDVFHLTYTALESLDRALMRVRFGAFVFAADDIVYSRHVKYKTARDNVIFELGLFMGRLGKENCFIVVPRQSPQIKLPSDLAGITCAYYETTRADHNLKAALTPPCNKIKKAARNQSENHQGIALSGLWDQTWSVTSRRYPKQNGDRVTLVQYGTTIISTHTAGNRTYLVEGTIEGQFVTGTWRDTQGGVAYHGTFQLAISPNEEAMEGKWVGFSEDNSVKCGKWLWQRVSLNSSKGKRRPATTKT